MATAFERNLEEVRRHKWDAVRQGLPADDYTVPEMAAEVAVMQERGAVAIEHAPAGRDDDRDEVMKQVEACLDEVREELRHSGKEDWAYSGQQQALARRELALDRELRRIKKDYLSAWLAGEFRRGVLRRRY